MHKCPLTLNRDWNPPSRSHNRSREMKSCKLRHCTCIISQSFPKQLLRRLNAGAWKGCSSLFRRKFTRHGLDEPRLASAIRSRGYKRHGEVARTRLAAEATADQRSGKQNVQNSAERCRPVLNSEASHFAEMQNSRYPLSTRRDSSITSESILAASWSDRCICI